MCSHTIAIYQILKAIDLSYEKQNYNFKTTFDLEKLKISDIRLKLILENLEKDEYILGINVLRSINTVTIRESTPRLTIKGMDFLENNSSMQKAYKALKEAKGWIPGF